MNIEQVKEEAKKRFNKDITDEQAKAWLDAHPTGELQDEELKNVAGGGCIGCDSEVRVLRRSPQDFCGAFYPRPEINDTQQWYNCNSCKYGFTDYSVSQPLTYCTRSGGPK